MWEAIQYVSSGLALVAFIVAAAAWIFKRNSEQTLRMVETAEEGDRANLVRSALEVVDVDTARLTNRQQYELAIELIRARAERFRITALVVCILAMILAAVSVSAILRMNPTAVQLSWAWRAPELTDPATINANDRLSAQCRGCPQWPRACPG